MKRLVGIFFSLAMLFMMCSSTFAYSLGGNPVVQAPGDAGSKAATIIGFMQWFGYAIAVGMLVYIGIKYIMASANEKADLKQALIKYVLGAVLIVFAVSIAGWVFGLNGDSTTNGGGTGGNSSNNNQQGSQFRPVYYDEKE